MLEVKCFQGMNVLSIEGRFVGNIVIYEQGEVLFETKTGNISCIVDKNTCQAEGFNVTQIKRAVKLNLTRKDNFYIKTGEDILGRNVYTLYLKNGLDVEYKGTQERLSLNTSTHKHYLSYGDIVFKNGVIYRKLVPVLPGDIKYGVTGYKYRYQDTTIERTLIQRSGYCKTEKTEYGVYVDKIKEELKEAGIEPHKYFNLDNILSRYDIKITKKVEGK